LLRDLVAQQSGFDCASRTELEAAINVGAPKSSIVYSNPIKDESDLEWAEKVGIKTTTADSID